MRKMETCMIGNKEHKGKEVGAPRIKFVCKSLAPYYNSLCTVSELFVIKFLEKND